MNSLRWTDPPSKGTASEIRDRIRRGDTSKPVFTRDIKAPGPEGVVVISGVGRG